MGCSSWYRSLASFSYGGDSGAKSSSSSSSLSSRSSLAVQGFELDEIDDGVWSLTWFDLRFQIHYWMNLKSKQKYVEN